MKLIAKSPLTLTLAVVTMVFCFFFDLRSARADEKQQCLSASEKAQQLRNAGKLTEARAELALCGRAECPKLVQQDCTQWMSEVLGILPSVVPGAKDRKGRDLIDVKVSIDGKVVTETLDGKALPIDPGVHTFKFETKSAPPVEEQVVVRQGEKNRILTITFATPDEAKKDPPPKKEAPPPEEKPSPPYAAYITGGVGVVALGVALFIDLDANSDARNLRDTCAPKCEQSQVDDVENRYVIAGVTAALGGAALIAGVVLYFTHSSGGKTTVKSTSKTLLPIPLAGSGVGFRF